MSIQSIILKPELSFPLTDMGQHYICLMSIQIFILKPGLCFPLTDMGQHVNLPQSRVKRLGQLIPCHDFSNYNF